MTADRLNLAANATVDPLGNITVRMPAVPLGLVWTGSLVVTTSAATTPWSAQVGGTSGGIPWGAPWYGAVPYGPVQAYGGETVTVTAAGLTPGQEHLVRWTGSSEPIAEAQPTWPVALGTPITIAPGSIIPGSSLPADWSVADADTLQSVGGLFAFKDSASVEKVSIFTGGGISVFLDPGSISFASLNADAAEASVIASDYNADIFAMLQAVIGFYAHMQLRGDADNTVELAASPAASPSQGVQLTMNAKQGGAAMTFRFGAGNGTTEFRMDDLTGTPIIRAADIGLGPAVGFFGVQSAQHAAIPDPAGGATVDVEARAAVVSILQLLRAFGPLAP